MYVAKQNAESGSPVKDASGNGGVWIIDYYRTLWYYLVKGGTLTSCPYFPNDDAARVQLWALAVTTQLWSEPHYRSRDFQEDSQKNLRNVALPGTSTTLNVLYLSKLVWVLFLVAAYPVLCLVAGYRSKADGSLSSRWRRAALYPDTWFNYWRLNCRLASYHELHNHSQGYAIEDKWTFTERCRESGVACAPCMELGSDRIIVKHRNLEGGMGLHTYRSCQSGGQWLIQEALSNRADIAERLPSDAPLSTLRVVTKSSAAWDASPSSVLALSCVWRAGRAKAQTDHCSVLFDVDMETGKLREGTVNHAWYPSQHEEARKGGSVFTKHPDTGAQLTGWRIEGLKEALELCTRAHRKMCPNVLLVGWDVALTTKGSMLLEGNLMCNFFQADFDRSIYFSFVRDAVKHIEATAKRPATQKGEERSGYSRRKALCYVASALLAVACIFLYVYTSQEATPGMW